jgi:5-methylcytosine-specific restriction protein A
MGLRKDANAVIARLITALNYDFDRWIDSDEIAEAMLHDPEGSALVRTSKQTSKFNDLRATAINMVAWWSQEYTTGENPFRSQFQRSTTQPYRYWARELGEPLDNGNTKTFILTWNPKKGGIEEDERRELIRVTATDPGQDLIWSTGGRKGGIVPGDRFFMFRLSTQRGIVASGTFTTGIELVDRRYHAEWGPCRAGISVDRWVSESQRLTDEDLLHSIPEVTWKRLQASGVAVKSPAAARKLHALWEKHLADGGNRFRYPEEEEPQKHREGFIQRVTVNRYERSPKARSQCIDHFGPTCSVCGFDFGAEYGEIGNGYIHVHHLVDISTVKSSYQIDPLKDLRPVCANCHAMLHTERPAMSIERLRRIIKNRLQPEALIRSTSRAKTRQIKRQSD